MTETTRPPLQRVAVLIPTYNERDTLPLAVRGVRAAVPDADVVVEATWRDVKPEIELRVPGFAPISRTASDSREEFNLSDPP